MLDIQLSLQNVQGTAFDLEFVPDPIYNAYPFHQMGFLHKICKS